MTYNPATDFAALVRNSGGKASVLEIPGLDFVVAALARAGLFTVSVSQTAPATSQASTVWVKPSQPSWTAEAQVFLWNGAAYVPATPALWAALLAPTPYVFQSTAAGSDIVGPATTLMAVQRVSPANTALQLPALANRNNVPLQIVDWSSSVVVHQIALTTVDGTSIMKQPSFNLRSTADQLTGVTLRPSTDLKGWVITP